jgi:hypothetical protein
VIARKRRYSSVRQRAFNPAISGSKILFRSRRPSVRLLLVRRLG